MDSISELRPLTPRPVAMAISGVQTAKASMATAEPKSVAAAPARAPEPELSRSQAAEQRLRNNRPEEGPIVNGAGAPEAEFSFGDFIDLINPLQHIPIVSTIYRAITGDQISGPAKILGGMLFGGPIGFIASVFDTIVAQATGRDLGETVLAAFVGQDQAPEVQIAEARVLEVISAQDGASQDGASEDGPPMAGGAPSPDSGRGDPFGLQRGTAAAIAMTPGALTPGAAPGTQPPALNARPLTVAAPWPQAAPVAAPVVAVELISATAPTPGNPRLVPNLATAERGFAERMLQALDKYQVLTTERYQDNSRAPRRLDLEL